MGLKLTNPWAVLALIFFVRVSIGVQFLALPAAAPYLVGELGWSYARVGWLTGLYMSPGILFSLPGGLLASRFGNKAMLVGGLLLMAGGMALFSATGSYPLMVAGRVIAGVGGVIVNVQIPTIVTDWFEGGKISTGMAVSASGFGFGTGVVTGVLGVLAGVIGWSQALLAAGLLPLAAVPVLLLVYADKHSPQPKGQRRLWAISGREVVFSSVAGMVHLGFITGYMVFVGFAPTLLIGQGMSVAAAGALVSLVALLTIVAVPLGGVLADITGRKDWFIVGGALGTALACLMLPLWGPPLLWILVFGILRGGCTGGIQSLPSEVLRAGSRATGFGVFQTLNALGATALLPVAGLLLDYTGDPAAAIWFAGVLWLSIVFFLAAFRYLHRLWLPGGIGPAAAAVA